MKPQHDISVGTEKDEVCITTAEAEIRIGSITECLPRLSRSDGDRIQRLKVSSQQSVRFHDRGLDICQ